MKLSGKILSGWLLVGIATIFLGCDRVDQAESAKMPIVQLSAEEWRTLLARRVVFGHQSVGQNILEGVQTLASQAGVKLPVVKLADSTGTDNQGLFHFFVGQNEDPSSKLQDFAKAFESGKAKGADVALVKFCYLDFSEKSNARALAEQYGGTLDHLSQKFPETRFVAVTAPLTVVQTGPKAWVKRLLGRTPSGLADNLRRREFNDLIRERYSKENRVFDLAKIESEGVGPHEYEKRQIEVLNPNYTYDDGHLNQQARELVASHLLKYLASMSLN